MKEGKEGREKEKMENMKSKEDEKRKIHAMRNRKETLAQTCALDHRRKEGGRKEEERGRRKWKIRCGS